MADNVIVLSIPFLSDKKNAIANTTIRSISITKGLILIMKNFLNDGVPASKFIALVILTTMLFERVPTDTNRIIILFVTATVTFSTTFGGNLQ